MIQLNDYVFTIDHHGEAHCKPNQGFGPGLKRSYLITVVLGGEGTFHIDNVTHKLTRHDVFLVPPNVLHYYQADQNNPWHYAWISFDADGFSEDFAAMGEQKYVRKMEHPETILHYISMIKRHELFGSVQHKSMREDAIIKLFLSELLDERKKGIEPSIIVKVQAVKDYIQNHYFEPLTVQDLADTFRYNRSYLCRMFKEVEGKSPKQYMVDLKMQIASNMLLASDASVENVSNSVGYTDSFTFSKMFKKRMGISPQEYKRYMISTLKQYF